MNKKMTTSEKTLLLCSAVSMSIAECAVASDASSVRPARLHPNVVVKMRKELLKKRCQINQEGNFWDNKKLTGK